MTKQKAIMVDVDGTLADMKGIRGPFEWDKVGLDRPYTDIIKLVQTLSDTGREADQLAIFVDRVRMTATTDYTLSGTTITFVRAPHNAAEVFVRVIDKEYKNESTDTFQQYKFESGRNHYKLNSDGKLVRVENKKMPIDETNFPDDVLDSEFAAYDGAAIVNSTSWSV